MLYLIIEDIIDVFRELIKTLNSSKFFIGIMMIVLNIGSKYIEIDLGKNHKQLLNNKIMRRILIFTIVFIATKDILISLIVTAVFVILVLNLFNQDSPLCILPKSYTDLDTNNDNKISDEEIIQAYERLKKDGKV
jgi:uncharacterized membrane protein (DUF485 family)|tara:strand:- start:130 stop:534 length:405 start_codon:yes stop_codon:yes gene_type:complete